MYHKNVPHMNPGEKPTNNANLNGVLTTQSLFQQIPIYLTVLGLLFTSFQEYAHTVERIASVESKVNTLLESVTELKADIKETRLKRDEQFEILTEQAKREEQRK